VQCGVIFAINIFFLQKTSMYATISQKYLVNSLQNSMTCSIGSWMAALTIFQFRKTLVENVTSNKPANSLKYNKTTQSLKIAK
jgi:hypothetical protein